MSQIAKLPAEVEALPPVKLRRIGVGCCGMKCGDVYEGRLVCGGVYAHVKLPNGNWTDHHAMIGFFEMVSEKMADPIGAVTYRDALRKRLSEATERQSRESLLALCNDIGIITNPSLRIAASVAAETLRARHDVAILLGLLEKMEGALDKADALIREKDFTVGTGAAGYTVWRNWIENHGSALASMRAILDAPEAQGEGEK